MIHPVLGFGFGAYQEGSHDLQDILAGDCQLKVKRRDKSEQERGNTSWDLVEGQVW